MGHRGTCQLHRDRLHMVREWNLSSSLCVLHCPLLASVRRHVQTQAGPLPVLFATYWAAEWFDPRVHPQVIVQVGLLGESFSAECAAERSEVVVDHHVLVQVSLDPEALLTHRTLEGPLPGVHAHVAHQMEVRGERFGAEGTVEALLRLLVSQGLKDSALRGVQGDHCSGGTGTVRLGRLRTVHGRVQGQRLSWKYEIDINIYPLKKNSLHELFSLINCKNVCL